MPSILTTKLYIPPPRPKAVARPRLYQKLAEGLSRPLTLISAPAGFGKSTLVSEWYDQARGAFRLAWISLDTEDNEPASFLAYLASAFERLQAGLGERLLAALDTPPPPGARAALGLLLRDLGGFIGTGVLVLDDYHSITSSEIHDLVAYLISNLPPDLHMIIATRADPPLPLGRLRVNDRLVEFRAADLLFRPEESQVFLVDTMGLSLSKEASARLATRTEGWAAGLQLAALAARSEDGQVQEAGLRGENPYLLDYLLEEVLARLPAEQQSFLLRTSLLDEFCGPLCDAILDATGSVKVLDSLYWANLFLIPLGVDEEGRQWFRYHHLFGESLRARLQQVDPVLVPELYCRAAGWYAGEGRLEAAIHYALAGGEIEQAMDWIEAAAAQYLKNGRAAPVRRWLESLPEDRLHSRSHLEIVLARTLFMTGDFAPAQVELDRLEQRLLRTSDPESRALLGEIYTLRATLDSMRGDWANTIAAAEEGLKLLPEADFHWRAVAALNLGNAYLLSGDYQAADAAFQNAVSAGLEVGNLNTVFTALANQAETRVIRGQLHEAEAALQQGLQLAHDGTGGEHRLAPTASMIYTGLGELYIERRNLRAAEAFIQQALALADQGGFVVAVMSAMAAQAHLKLARGMLPEAQNWVEQATKVVQGTQAYGLLGQLEVLRMRLLLELGDRMAVEHWIQDLDLESGAGFDYLSESQAILRLRLYRSRGQVQPGLELAGQMLAAAQAGQRLGRALEIRLQLALLYRQSGDHPEAEKALREALQYGAPRGFVGMFLEAGEELRPLMQALVRSLAVDDPLRDTVRRILRAYPSGENGQETANEQLIEPLSGRELDVLNLVARGASNQEIADRLVISLGTVKSHVHHIQGKLGSRSRVELVQRAKDLGLV